MLRLPKLGLCLLGLAVLLQCTIAPAARAQQFSPQNPMRIGMVESLFTDVSPWMVKAGSIMFGSLMKSSTGIDGEMLTGGDVLTVAKKLNDGKLDLAVFHGVEFAWAQQNFPNLRPLMVAITKYKSTQAYIVVRKDGPISSFDNLQGKDFVMPLCSREHCRLFLNRCCSGCGPADPQQYFSQVVKTSTETALDEVCKGNAQATVVDKVAWENYESLKPGCAARLSVLKSSELFPTGVIAYREGALNRVTQIRLTSGLLTAEKTDMGRELMAGFKITSFEAVPENYTQALAEIMKIYPSPAVAPR